MTFAAEFGDLLNDTVTVEPRIGVDGFNRPQYGAPVEVRGRLERRNRQVLGLDSVVRVAGATFYCGPLPIINPGDKITFPESLYPRSEPPILSVERLADESSQYYQGVMVG